MELVWVLDCADPQRLADFWATALGYRRGEFTPPYLSLVDPSGRWPELLLQQVPEPKRVKNRMHLDLRVADLQPDLDRLLAAGARKVHEPCDDSGWLTCVLGDPEDNEFCLLVPPTPTRQN